MVEMIVILLPMCMIMLLNAHDRAAHVYDSVAPVAHAI